MSFDPIIFGENLKKSSLTKLEQEAILDQLEALSLEQVYEIDAILKKDIKKQESIFKKAQLKADIIVKNFKKSFTSSLKEAPPHQPTSSPQHQ